MVFKRPGMGWHKDKNMKTLDIQAKEWFDTKNGNSYFSALVTVDYLLPTEKKFSIPFQYGYGNQFEFEALKVLQSEKMAPTSYNSLSRFCANNQTELNSNMKKNCTLKQVKTP